MIICDTHLHSEHSHDSKAPLEELCYEAIKKGLKVLCTTEHIFLESRDAGYGYFNMENYLKEVERCNKKFQGKLLVLSGIEFSEPHIFYKELKEIKKYELDIIVGAIHWIDEGIVNVPSILKKLKFEEVVRKYYDRVLEAVKKGGFNTFAHLDLIKRIGEIPPDQISDKVDEILHVLVKSDIGIEINTSGIRRGEPSNMPSNAILDRYIEIGGRKITVGSDSHKLGDVASDFNKIDKKYHQYIGFYCKGEFVNMNTWDYSKDTPCSSI